MFGKYIAVTDERGDLLEDEMTLMERAALIALAAIWSGSGLRVLIARCWSQGQDAGLIRGGEGGVTVTVPAKINGTELAADISHASGWRAVYTPADSKLYICPTGSARP